MTDLCCDLEVDVNGEGVFMVDKGRISSYSPKFSALFAKSASSKGTFKVIIHDFPGGAEIFELIVRFCYNNGVIDVTPGNLNLLYSAAHFMEMRKSVSGTDNLMVQLEKSLEEISYWTWSDLLLALKQNQDLPVDGNCARVLEKIMDALVGRLVLAAETSPCPSMSSPESSGFRISCDSRSSESIKTSCSRPTWWFDDFATLNPRLIERAVKFMVYRKYDHRIISKFLFHYQKSKSVHGHSLDKCKVIEMVVDLLYTLDHWSISYKNLLGIFRISLSLNLNKSTRSRLENMIGLRLDEATLDYLLIPSPAAVNCLYDVNLVLRFLKSFLSGELAKVSSDRAMKVANLLDLYLSEVAPDPCLKPTKFIAVATALPDSFRDNYDRMYHAMDMYLEVHTDLSENELFKICSALNYEKLSPEACLHLSKNKKFPSRSAVQALISQHLKLKGLLQNTSYPNSGTSSPSFHHENEAEGGDNEVVEQLVLFQGKIDAMTENQKLRAHLKGMQWRVTELENVCRKMQNQMAKMMKSMPSSNSNTRSLPKLCS